MAKEQEAKIRQLNEVLRPWRGAHGQLWSYTSALATLEIRLFFPQRPGNIHVVCSPCVSLAGPAYWERCELAVAGDPADDSLFIVQDEGACVRVLCRQLWTFENVESLFASLLAGQQENSID